MKRMQLFCLPYAGGSSSMYHEFASNLPEWIEMIPIEYSEPGQKNKHSSFQHMVRELAVQVQELWDEKPFAIMGYSMGSLVAYELYYEILQKYNRKPIHMFFAAHVPPSQHTAKHLTRTDVEKRVKANLSSMGVNLPITEQQTLLEWIVPKYLKDLDLYSKYSYVQGRQGIDANITVLYSDEENQQRQIFDWSPLSSKFCMYHRMGTSHFFINQGAKRMAWEVSQSISNELRQPVFSN
ncbi:thioesterase domain-containing protein [Priestia sp. FSL H7-0729]